MPKLWTINEVAEFLQVPVGTLYAWRTKNYGPRGTRIGRYVRYNPEDVFAWLESITEPAR